MEPGTYYSRHLMLKSFGDAAHEKMTAARVLVIGAGGLGCPVAMYLAGAGVGEIAIMDFDCVELSNIQRQVIFTIHDIGKGKAETAVEFLRQRNPFIKITAINEKFSVHNARSLVAGYDVVIDGTDNFKTRYRVNDACVLENVPFLSGSVLEFEGQVMLLNANNGPTYRCVFPDALEATDIPACSTAGVLNTLTGWVGTTMAQEAVKFITGIGDSLNGRLRVMNALNGSIKDILVQRGPNARLLAEAGLQEITGVEVHLSLKDWKSRFGDHQNAYLVNLAEEWEFSEYPEGVNIPLPDFPSRYNGLGASVVGFMCKSGHRSEIARQWLIQNHPETSCYIIDNPLE